MKTLIGWNKSIENDHLCNSKEKKAGVAKSISDKRDFTTKII